MNRPIEIIVSDSQGHGRLVDVYDYKKIAGLPERFNSVYGAWLPPEHSGFWVEGARWQDTGKDLTQEDFAEFGEQIDEKAFHAVSGV